MAAEMPDGEVPPWPEKPQRETVGRFAPPQWSYKGALHDAAMAGVHYECDRADAALARLRIAVKALEGCSGGWGGLADKALKQIGEIPNDE